MVTRSLLNPIHNPLHIDIDKKWEFDIKYENASNNDYLNDKIDSELYTSPIEKKSERKKHKEFTSEIKQKRKKKKNEKKDKPIEKISEKHHEWNSRFTMEEMPEYNPKQDLYLKKAIPIDSFGAYGVLESKTKHLPLVDANILHKSDKKEESLKYIHSKSETKQRKRKKLTENRPKFQNIYQQLTPITSRDLQKPKREISSASASARTHKDVNKILEDASFSLDLFRQSLKSESDFHLPVSSLRGLQNLKTESYYSSHSSDTASVASNISTDSGLSDILNLRSESPSQLLRNPLLSKSHNALLSKASQSPLFTAVPSVNQDRLSSKYFSDLISSLRRLWSDLDIPDSERMKIIVNNFQSASEENITALENEQSRLIKIREITIHILRNIEQREDILLRLKYTCEYFEKSDIGNRILLGSKLLYLYQSALELSVIIADTITIWKTHSQIRRTFPWNGEDYLEKMKSDIKWFEESSIIRRIYEMGIDIPKNTVDSNFYRQRPLSGGKLLNSLPKRELNIIEPDSSPVALTPLSKKKTIVTPLENIASLPLINSDLNELNSKKKNYSSLREIASKSQFEYSTKPSLIVNTSRNQNKTEIEKIFSSESPSSSHSSLSIETINDSDGIPLEKSIIKTNETKITSHEIKEQSGLSEMILRIQLMYRSWKAKKIVSQLKKSNAASIIQRWWRYLKAIAIVNQLRTNKETERVQKRNLEEFDFITFTIRQIENFNLSLREYNTYKKNRKLIVLIQSLIRQKQVEQFFLWKSSFSEFGVEDAALLIQCIIRMRLKKDPYDHKLFLNHKKSEIIFTQNLIRRYQALQSIHQIYKQKNEIKKLQLSSYYQQIARCILSRRKVEALRREKYNEWLIVHLQSKIRTILQVRIIRDKKKKIEFERFQLAKQVVENFIVNHIARINLYNRNFDYSSCNIMTAVRVRMQQSALTIQCFFRRWKARKLFDHLQRIYNMKKTSCEKILAVWRGYKCRTVLLPQRRIEYSRKLEEYKIFTQKVNWTQNFIRRCLAFIELKKRYIQTINLKSNQATKIQIWYRSIKAKQYKKLLQKEYDRRIESYLRREYSTNIIQKAWRRYKSITRQYTRTYVQSIEPKIFVIQKAIRSFLARKRLSDLRKYEHQQQEQLINQEISAVTIQCAYRKYIAFKRFKLNRENRLKRRYLPVIERTLLLWRKKRLLIKAANKERSAIIIQKYARSRIIQIYLFDKSARIIQKFFRQIIANKFKKSFQQEKLKVITSIIFVQRTMKKYYGVESKIILVQNVIRQKLSENEYRLFEMSSFTDAIMGKEAKIQAANVIRRVVLVFLAKKKLQRLKKEKINIYAIKIQKFWRSYRARLEAKRLLILHSFRRKQRLQEEEKMFWSTYISQNHPTVERGLNFSPSPIKSIFRESSLNLSISQ